MIYKPNGLRFALIHLFYILLHCSSTSNFKNLSSLNYTTSCIPGAFVTKTSSLQMTGFGILAKYHLRGVAYEKK